MQQRKQRLQVQKLPVPHSSWLLEMAEAWGGGGGMKTYSLEVQAEEEGSLGGRGAWAGALGGRVGMSDHSRES